jgi:N-methylhydantoinase A/oxoprolinase/acetone carboxylase beta subunit
VDTGGTFTDVVGEDGRVAKVLSTPGDPGDGVRAGVDALVGVGRPGELAHGTTVATNALLERRGAVVALVTDRGFADLVEIGRQRRPSLYDQRARRPPPLVSRERRLELGVDGEVPEVPGDVEAVAVVLLGADLDPGPEETVAGGLRARGRDVTCSHEVSPQFREYERLSTTVANAYLRPMCGRYLAGIDGTAARVLVLTSAGGLVPVGEGARTPARLLLSGPAGGVLAAAAAAAAAGYGDAVTFDMGGTSTDVCLVLDGRPAPAGERSVAGLPIRLPSLDVHTIGAGGGSIARIDAGGALAVGPRSAGAAPGPACYGRGGTEPTVTDADLAAGRIRAGSSLPGLGELDLDAAVGALGQAGVTADGVIEVVDAAMTQALRQVTVERGVDPVDVALVAFGGAGPLHACALADALGIRAVIVPPRAGVLSAVGLLGAPEQVDLVASRPDPADLERLGPEGSALGAAATARLVAAGGADGPAGNVDGGLPPGTGTARAPAAEVTFDCRYAGQSWELTVPSVDDFHAEHERRNGYRREGVPVEVVAVRATARRASRVDIGALPAVDRRGPVRGPAVIAEPDCTVWVAGGWVADVHRSGSWILRRS